MSSLITRSLLVPASLAALYLLFTVTASAQTNTENFAQFEFNFNNPGARAAGIGGAFISIADDATAAEANPAGLTSLIRPEFSFEVKGVRFDRTIGNFAHSGTQTNYTMISKDFQNTVISPSFASVVFPVSRFCFSAFRYELVNFESGYYTKGSYTPPDTLGYYFFPVKSEINAKIVNWGAAAAYKISRKLSLGASFGLSHMTMDSYLNRYNVEVFVPSNIANVATINDAGNDFFVNAGVMFQPRDNLSFGAVFKRRPHFSLKHTFQYSDFPADSIAAKSINFYIPMSIGAGVSYRPIDVLTLAFDADYVSYSGLTKDLVLTIAESVAKPGDYKSDDGMEFHFGAEYVLLFKSVGFVLRSGLYSEPDKAIRWVGSTKDTTESRTAVRVGQAALFQPGKSVLHYTFGLGLIISNNFQFDVAGALSSTRNEVIGSLVVRL